MKYYFTLLVTTILFTNVAILSAQHVGVGTDNPVEFFSVGANSPFRVNANGNLVRINDVQYNFPATQATSGSILANDGSGNLSWTKVTTGNISATGTANNTTFLRGDGAWAVAGGAEQFPMLVTTVTISGSQTTYASWSQIFSTTAPSSGFFMIHLSMVMTSTDFSNPYIFAFRHKVDGVILTGSETNNLSFAGVLNGTGPGYHTATFLCEVTAGQTISIDFAMSGNNSGTVSWISPSKVRIIKLSN